jgi:hypothetical protein
VDNGSFSVDPAAADAARAGTAPYPGAQARPVVELTKPLDPEQQKAGDPYTDPDAAPKSDPVSPTDDTTADTAEAKPAEESKEETDAAAPVDDAAIAAFDPAPFLGEFNSTGALSDESRATVKEALPGVTDEMISAYLHGIKAGQAEYEAKGFAVVGGQENYAAMADWTRANVPRDERIAFNKMLEAGDHTAKLAIEGMFKRYTDAVGPTDREPNLSTVGQRAAGTAPIRSRADLRAKIRDPRYAKDPSFRAEVDRQLSASLKNPDYRSW